MSGPAGGGDMKSRPIPFNGEMVRAILDGSKTQTRRPVKPQPPCDETARWVHVIHSSDKRSTGTWRLSQLDPNGFHFSARGRETVLAQYVQCPYGLPGNELWVRETWRIGSWKPDPGRFGDLLAIDYRATNGERTVRTNPTYGADGRVDHVADRQRVKLLRDAIARTKAAHAKGLIGYDADTDEYPWEPGKAPLPWRPSILMPRWASRITLRVTDVRVQRLRDITTEDARAEGFMNPAHFITAFQAMYPGEPNPWVWALTFQRVSP